MRGLVLLTLMALSTLSFAQVDSVKVASKDLIRIAAEQQTLKAQLDAQKNVTQGLQDHIKLYQELHAQDDTLVNLLSREIDLRTNFYTKLLEDQYKPNRDWWKEGLFFLGGAAFAFIGVRIATAN